MTSIDAVPLRLGPALEQAIRRALEPHPRRTLDVVLRKQAAVLIPLYERAGEAWVVLTKRTDTVRTHKGEISFPGGTRDPGDDDLWATALRETREELGIDPRSVTLLGALDDHPTFVSGYVVAPFVGGVDPTTGWKPSEHEIAEVIELPLRTLFDVVRTEEWAREGIRYPMPLYDVGPHRVWGVTAFILTRFLGIVGPALGFGGGA